MNLHFCFWGGISKNAVGRIKLKNVEIDFLRLDSGEDFSYLLNRTTHEIIRLSFLYSLHRRVDCQPLTIKNITQSIAYLYNYTIDVGFNVDDYLLGEKKFDYLIFQTFVKSLFQFLKAVPEEQKPDDLIYNRLAPGSFITYWRNIHYFIAFWLQRSMDKQNPENHWAHLFSHLAFNINRSFNGAHSMDA